MPIIAPTATISVIFFFSTSLSFIALENMTPLVMTEARGKPVREEGKEIKKSVRRAFTTLFFTLEM